MGFGLGVLISGNGSNLQAIIERIRQGTLEAEIKLVVSNEPEAYGLERAKAAGINVQVINHRDYADRQRYDLAVAKALRREGVQVVCLAGYMRLVSQDFIQAFSGQVLNIHPGLLPAFKGISAQKKAAENGVKIAGATVHFVDQKLDNGPIIIQAALGVGYFETGDSLAQRILCLEHRIYPQAIQWLVKGRLIIEKGKVYLDRNNEKIDVCIMGQDREKVLICPALESGF